MNYTSELHEYIPGGAHTYSRGEDTASNNLPKYLKRGKGAYVWDENDKKYLDYGMALRANILGYSNDIVDDGAIEQIKNGNNLTKPSEIELIAAKKLVQLIPWVEQVKFAKNGSNVTTAAVKLARAYNNKSYVITCQDHPFFSFDDWFIGTTPLKRGTLFDKKCPFLNNSAELKFKYNDIESLEEQFLKFPNDIAAVIMEPCTTEDPKIYEDGENFLHKAHKLCKKYNSVFIIDEMITGFRFGITGACGLYNISPDLVTYGKAIANGFSLAVLGGKKEIMSLGDVITEGRERTFLLSSTHGAEMCSLGAMVKNLDFIIENNVSNYIRDYGEKLIIEGNKISEKLGLIDYFNFDGLFQGPYFVTRNENKDACLKYRTLFLQEMCKNGVIMAWIAVSFSHGENEMKITLDAIEKSLIIYKKALDEGIDKYLESYVIKSVFRKYN
jgi:glutamate-1-semialdehyde 2,1-aminomutase|uniref:Glutamate-1-semialdehyde 2,1-aminomutase n=1 Tax=viral metagenome TaxID=1070528 RepID=A0A6C0IY75_9ZZZZ